MYAFYCIKQKDLFRADVILKKKDKIQKLSQHVITSYCNYFYAALGISELFPYVKNWK